MSQPRIALIVALAAIGLVVVGLLWMFDTPRPPTGASRAQTVYYQLCVACHGTDGRGSRRAALFLVKPGDFTNRAQMDTQSDRYLFDIIKSGGSPIGVPGMPAFGSELSDADIEALVAYVRGLSRP